MTENNTPKEDPRIDELSAAFEGLSFRRYNGTADLSAMAEVMTRSREADGVEYVTTESDLEAQYDNPLDFDPKTDVIILETEGRIIGMARVWREERREGKKIFGQSVELLANWRGKGIREALFHYNERHIQKIAKMDHRKGPGYVELWANDSENEWKSIVVSNGYRPVQHEIDMVRSLDDIPGMPLPEGFEIRAVVPEHLGEIQKALKESMRKDWNFSEKNWDDEHFEAFKKSHVFQPNLWQVAWKGDTLAGTVLNYIVDEENTQFDKKRGHTEFVFVREQFRGKGLARALLARSLHVLKARGMNEAMLGMELENPHDPMRLYKGMGFEIVRHFTWYHKPID